MDTTIERKFFYAYDSTEWIEDCTYWIKIRRGLSACTEEAESKRHWYEEELPAKIMEWADSIRDEVYGECSPLMQEITANIDSLTDEWERERYIFSLLSPFGKYVKLTDIDEKIARINQDIEEDREQIAAWREIVGDDETPQKEKAYGEGAIETLSELIDKNKEELVRKQKERETFLNAHLFPHGNAERAFRQMEVFVTKYGVALDAHLLERRIDLIRYERIAGIKLVGKRRKDLVGDYLGNEKLAQYYIDALPKLDEQQAEDTRQGEQDKGTTNLPTISNTYKVNGTLLDNKNFVSLLEKVAKDLLLRDSGGSVLQDRGNGKWTWKTTKQYQKGLLVYLCGRFFCGDYPLLANGVVEWVKGDKGNFPFNELSMIFVGEDGNPITFRQARDKAYIVPPHSELIDKHFDKKKAT